MLFGFAGSFSKVEIFTDPGIYDGFNAKFEDWWTKMKVWLDQKLADGNTWFHNWNMLVKEIEGLFHPQLQVNWVKNKISWFSQGDLDIDTFITKWQSLYHQSKINATIGIWLLENKVSPHIYFKLFHTNACKATINETLMEIRKITKTFEAYTLFSHDMTGEPFDKPNIKKCFGKRAEVEDPQGADDAQINAFRLKKPNVKMMKYFNYGESSHKAKKCQKLKNKCPECHFLGGSHKKDCWRSTTQGSSACSANSSLPTTFWDSYDPSHIIRGMDYEQIKAYFFDLKDTQDWSNGKEKGLANWLIWIVSSHYHHIALFCPSLLKVA